MLDNISKEAWAIIATTFEEQEKLPAKSSVAANATVVAFSERLLRDIINLADSQQLELVRDFLAVVGSLKPSEWIDKVTGALKSGLSVTVNNSLSPYDIKKRRPATDSTVNTGSQAKPFDDELLF